VAPSSLCYSATCSCFLILYMRGSVCIAKALWVTMHGSVADGIAMASDYIPQITCLVERDYSYTRCLCVLS
jgi:hypothetical protein